MSRQAALLLALSLAASDAGLTAPNAGIPATSPGLDSSFVSTSRVAGGFTLVENGRAATLVVSDADYPGVRRAVSDLRRDVERVTGTVPRVSASDAVSGAPVIIGTLGKSPLIDHLVRSGKFDASALSGRWESYVLQVVDRPMDGVDRALVIAGSDKRGTIYGIYDLSREIGVSPWYWWADVPPRRASTLVVKPTRVVSGEPKVKYRGIFINDEAPAFSGWAREKLGGVNHRVYERMFELILRLKGNYLWPAMWGNAFADDDSLNAKLADEYGIVMGTSHHEPMTRAQQEWRRYGKGPWNYEQNDSTLRDFWRRGIARMGSRENIVTIGMRGDGDMPMTEGSNVALLERIVADQRKIIADVTGEPASATPQLWALYKEVQDYYDKGMRVPDDVTLLFSDDNWGNIRRLPTPSERGRPGGFGVYYHFDYVGGPRNYKWINTNPIARVWEQMNLAYRSGADRIWIVNVGDLKPMEFPIQFFLDLAWNPDAIPAERLSDYTRQWAGRQFGAAFGDSIGDLITRSLKLAGRRKPELLDTATYSLFNYREAERVVAEYDTLATRAKRIGTRLDPAYRDAYFELVLHPILAAGNLNALYVTAARNRLYARQGRTATNTLADSARALFRRDAELSTEFHSLAGGKWAHMMDQTHIGYTYWQEPPRDVMPRVDEIHVPVAAELGVAPEGQAPFVPGQGGPPPSGAPRRPTLPTFDAYQRQSYFIDIYNRGQTAFEFAIAADQPWVKLSRSHGAVNAEERVWVSVNWASVPTGQQTANLTITGPNRQRVVVQALADNRAGPDRDRVVGFVEGSGYVSMEAEHYSKVVNVAPVSWMRIPDFGRTLSGMTTSPADAPSQTLRPSSPRLEYELFMFDSGSVDVRAYVAPSLNVSTSPAGLRYAISFDDEAPQTVNVLADSSIRAWERSVAENIRVATTRHSLSRAGKHVLKFWRVDPGVVLEKLVVDAGGVKPSYLGPPESFFRPTRVAPASDARFDWFEYAGDDSIYHSITPGRDRYLNPILAGFYPDPSITRARDDYYLVTSSFTYFPGIPIFHSRDLVHWKQIGHVLDRPTQLSVDNRGVSEGIYAPAISYHDGTFYLITTCSTCGGNFIVTATDPAGPWSEPIWLRDVDGIDPSLFFDDDGRAYIVNNGPPVEPPRYNGHRAIWFQEYDLRARRMIGPRKVIVNGGVDIAKKPIWIEAPHILKVDGRYYLICAEGGTADQHSEVVFRSDSVGGPYIPYSRNPILSQRQLSPARPAPLTSTGHADFVQTPRGEWWAVFLGVRPYGPDLTNIGRETFMLPVHWRDGWPTILEDTTATVPYSVEAPALSSDTAGADPTSGNFRVRDEFTGRELGPAWVMLRTPRDRWYDLTSNPGSLTLHARSIPLGIRAQPAFIGRRQQHASMTATTAMRYTPSRAGDAAGLVAFQSDSFYYFLGETMYDGKPVVRLARRAGTKDGGAEVTVAEAPLGSRGDAPLFLRITARGGRYDFSYAERP
ncbi:MAG TPA: glycosyl hydrolase 115 family protein, partial [Gemmatimonadaceae bacterium]|nr:glycosyl hydrolase 115 family protein [Gemmatimonadaceae bacterium]